MGDCRSFLFLPGLEEDDEDNEDDGVEDDEDEEDEEDDEDDEDNDEGTGVSSSGCDSYALITRCSAN